MAVADVHRKVMTSLACLSHRPLCVHRSLEPCADRQETSHPEWGGTWAWPRRLLGQAEEGRDGILASPSTSSSNVLVSCARNSSHAHLLPA